MMVVAEAPTIDRVNDDLNRRLAPLRDGDWLKVPSIEESDHPSSANFSDLRISGALGMHLQFGAALPPPISRYVLEQEFEGVVLAVSDDGQSFQARLVDLTGDLPDEEADLDFDEISADDHKLIKPGALFSWTMGRTTCRRQVFRHSEIRFRRVFRFTKSDVERSKKRAREIFALLTDDA
jgi:hypothetical protein